MIASAKSQNSQGKVRRDVARERNALTYRERLICNYVAQGFSVLFTARLLEVDRRYINQVLAMPAAQEYLEHCRRVEQVKRAMNTRAAVFAKLQQLRQDAT